MLLKDAGLPYRINHRLVRGLDYYNRTVFEWVTTRLGAQGHDMRRGATTVCGPAWRKARSSGRICDGCRASLGSVAGVRW